MWEDVLKNQITIPKQNVKTRRSPLPEKEEPDCYKIIDDIFQAWADCNKVQRPAVRHARDGGFLSELTNEDWCEMVKDRNNNLIIHPDNKDDPDIFSVRYYIPLTDKQSNNVQLYLSWNISKRFNKWRVWQYAEIDFGDFSSDILGTVIINWDSAIIVEPNVFTEGYVGKLLDTSKNCLNFADKLKQMKPFVNKIRHTNGDYSQAQRLIFDMVGDGGISKSQITVPKQSVKTKRTPLPEKDDERCYPKIHKIVQEFYGKEYKDKYRVDVISAESKRDNQFWCDNINYKDKVGIFETRILTAVNTVNFGMDLEMKDFTIRFVCKHGWAVKDGKPVIIYRAHAFIDPNEFSKDGELIHTFGEEGVAHYASTDNADYFEDGLIHHADKLFVWLSMLERDYNVEIPNKSDYMTKYQENLIKINDEVRENRLWFRGGEYGGAITKADLRTQGKESTKIIRKPLPEKEDEECRPKVLRLGDYVESLKNIIGTKLEQLVDDINLNDPPVYSSNHRFSKMNNKVGEITLREEYRDYHNTTSYILSVPYTYSLKFHITVNDIKNVTEWSACKTIELWSEKPDDRFNGISKIYKKNNKDYYISAATTNPKTQTLGRFEISGDDDKGRWNITISWGYGFAYENEMYLQQQDHTKMILSELNFDSILRQWNSILGSPIKKSQIQTGRQNVKTRRKPLPEKEKSDCRDEVAGWRNIAFRKAVLLKKILIDAKVGNFSTIVDLKHEDFKIIDGQLKEYCCCKMIEAINQVESGEQDYKQNPRTGTTISNYLDKQYPFEYKGQDYVLACQFTSSAMRNQKSIIGFVATLYDDYYEGSIKDKYVCDIVVENMLDNYEIIPAEIMWWNR